MTREEVLQRIKYVWEDQPNMRLGQLLCTCANYVALCYSSDEELIKMLEQKYDCDTSRKFALESSEVSPRTDIQEQQLNALREQICALEAQLKASSSNKTRSRTPKRIPSTIEQVEQFQLEGKKKDQEPKNRSNRKEADNS